MKGASASGTNLGKAPELSPNLQSLHPGSKRSSMALLLQRQHLVHRHLTGMALKAKAGVGRACGGSGSSSSSTTEDCPAIPSMGKVPMPLLLEPMCAPHPAPHPTPTFHGASPGHKPCLLHLCSKSGPLKTDPQAVFRK